MTYTKPGQVVKSQTTNIGEQMAGQALQAEQAQERQALSITTNALNSITSGMQRIAGVAAQEYEVQQAEINKGLIEKGLLDGELAVAPEQYEADLKEGDDPYAVAWNEAQRAKVASNVQILTSQRIAEMAAQYSNDPTAFKSSVNGLRDAMREELKLAGENELIVARTIDESMQRYLPKITQNGYAAAKQEEMGAYNAATENLVNLGLSDIRNGNYDRLTSLMADVDIAWNKGVERGIYSEADRAEFVDSVLLEANEQMLLSFADNAIQSGDFNSGRIAIETWRDSEEKTGKFSPDELDAIQGKATQQINQAQKAWEMQQKENAKVMKVQQKKQDQITMVDNFMLSGLPMPKGKENQAAIDTFFDERMQGVSLADPEGRQAIIGLVSKTKLLPTKVKEAIKTSSLSTDPNIVNIGASFYDQIAVMSPRTIANSLTETEQAYFENYRKALGSGYNAEEAIEYAGNTTYGKDKEKLTALRLRTDQADYKESRRGSAEDFISGRTGFFEFDPDLGEAARENVMFESEYNTAYDIAFEQTGGDAEASAKIADRTVGRKWGVTAINGSNQLMRFTPEGVYGSEGNTEWIANQWNTEQATLQADVFGGWNEGNKIILVSDLKTGREQQPSWAIMVQSVDEFGVTQVTPYYDKKGIPTRWRPDFAQSEEYLNDIKSKEEAYNRAKLERERKSVNGRQGATIPKVTNYGQNKPSYLIPTTTYKPNIGGL